MAKKKTPEERNELKFLAVVEEPKKQLALIKGGKNGIVQVFLDSDFRNAHEGLSKIAKDAGIDMTTLEPGQYVVFVNHSMDRIKLYGAYNVIAYQKLPEGQKVDLRSLSHIPRAFHGGSIHYDAALKSVLLEKLA